MILNVFMLYINAYYLNHPHIKIDLDRKKPKGPVPPCWTVRNIYNFRRREPPPTILHFYLTITVIYVHINN